MMKKLTTTLLIICISVAVFAQETVSMQVNAKADKDKISRFIYGHFAEHLGPLLFCWFLFL